MALTHAVELCGGEHNNHPEIVRNSAHLALERARRALFTRLVVAEPKQQSEVFTY